MSQVDIFHFFPALIWIIIMFVLWYAFIIVKIIPKYYKILRGRYIYEKNLWDNIKEDEYVIKVVENFIYMNIWKVKEIKTIAILTCYKNIILLNDIEG